MLYAMSIKDYIYEDPSKDLEKLIVLIQNDETPFILDDILDVVSKFYFLHPTLLTVTSFPDLNSPYHLSFYRKCRFLRHLVFQKGNHRHPRR
jgi:hypothetical protein